VSLALGAGPLAACHEDPAPCCDLLTGCRPCPLPTPPARPSFAAIGFGGTIGGGDFLGYVPVGTSASHVVLVRNGGNGATTRFATTLAGVSGSPPGLEFAGGAYPGSGGTCGTALGSGETCRLLLTLSPAETTLHAATVRVAYALPADSARDEDVAALVLEGIGFDGPLPTTIAPSPWDFGRGPRSATFAVANTTGAPLPMDCALFLVSGVDRASFAVDGGTCCAARQLEPAASCTVSVAFTPMSAEPVQAGLSYPHPATLSNIVQLLGEAGP
jgi:hypothetical protein